MINARDVLLKVAVAHRVFCLRAGKIGRTTFYRHVSANRISSVKVGTQYRISLEELNRVIDEGIPRKDHKQYLAVKLAYLILILLVRPALAQHSVTLTWQASGCPIGVPTDGYINCNSNTVLCNHVTGYKVYRAPNLSGSPGAFALLGSTTGALTYIDTSVLANDVWWYAVTVMVDSPCESGYSNEILAPVPPNVGDVMYWNSGRWLAKTPATPINVQTTPIGTPPTAGDILMWYSNRWMPRTPVVPVARVGTGDIIVWNGTMWASKTPITPVKK